MRIFIVNIGWIKMLTKQKDINSLIDGIHKLNAKEQEEISRL